MELATIRSARALIIYSSNEVIIVGYIYKIQNKINNKVYIGQTVKTLEKRFHQHQNNFDKPYFSQIVLYKAFKKYGIENFTFEGIEEVSNEYLDEREKYWIQKYDSYLNGYNSTLGGRLIELYDWDIDEIIELYHQYKSARQVAKILSCDHSTIDRLLNAEHVHRYTQAEQKGNAVILKKDSEVYRFSDTVAAAQWLMDNNFTKSKRRTSVRQYINYYASGAKTGKYLGFEIYYESKIQSTPLVTEE